MEFQTYSLSDYSQPHIPLPPPSEFSGFCSVCHACWLMVDYFLAAFATFDYERIFSRAVLSLNPMGLQFPDLWSQILTGPSLGSLLPEASPSFRSKCTQPKALPSASQAESSKTCCGLGIPGQEFHCSHGDVVFVLLVIGHSRCRLKEGISLDANLTFWMWP